MALLGKTKKDILLEFRTSEILHAARTVFARHGFQAATVDEIAETAGVAKGTVYLYFPSKRDLFLATFRAGVLDLHEEVMRRTAEAPSTREKVRAFIHARIAYCGRNRDFFRIYYIEFASLQVRGAKDRPEFQDLYDKQANLLEEILRDGVRDGEVRFCNIPVTARLIYDVTRSAIARHVLESSSGDIEESTNIVCDLIWRGIAC